MKPLIAIVMGSDSDLAVMEEAGKVLDSFGIGYEITIASAHRSPDKTREYIHSAEKNGIKIIIAGAGWAAHLAGVIAAETTMPVIGVPIDSSPLLGLDSILSILQMPSGIPVAAMALGKGGAKNAAILAVQILAVSDKSLQDKLKAYKKKLSDEVEEKDKKIKSKYQKNI
ncbi:MAG: 5-(carboxyamino)imidazole ribonucleotide mutase [Nitrospinae bacterium]|nr:5-(carboxyamino)imidazole ribonucleotide mutase [Nitrospinota bacterium]